MSADNIDSIRGVQEAEAEAKRIIEDATKRRDSRIAEAERRARKIIEDAEADSNAAGEAVLKKADSEILGMRKRRLAEAAREAERLRKSRLSKRELDKLAEETAKSITG